MVKKEEDKGGEKAVEKGLGFGITSGVITTLGMIVGLDSATHSFGAIVGGIMAISIADAFSDALGMHISEETQKKIRDRNIWVATISTFFSKFIFAISFIVPFLLFELATAVTISIGWGIFLLIVYNFRLARKEKKDPVKVIAEHVAIAILVIFVTHYVGHLVRFLS